MALPTCVRVTRLIYGTKTRAKLLLLESSYLHPAGGQEDTWKTFPQSGVKFKDGSPYLPPFLTTFPRYENNFITSHWHQTSLQTRSFESAFFNLSTGQVHIPQQLYLRTNMKKITYISNPDIFSPCLSSKLVGNLLCICDPISCKKNTQEVGISTSFSTRHSYCLQRWVGSTHL